MYRCICRVYEIPKGSHKLQGIYIFRSTVSHRGYDAVCVLQVPKSIPAWQAAFIEPLACSVHAVELGSVQFRDTVVIAGCGPLGLGMVAAAKLKNPTCVIALDLYDWKVEPPSLSFFILLPSLLSIFVYCDACCSWRWRRNVELMWFSILLIVTWLKKFVPSLVNRAVI